MSIKPVFIILVISTNKIYSQTPKDIFDSLSETIKHSTYFDSIAVFNNGKKAIQIARELNDLSKEALIYQYYGSYNYHSGKMDQAKRYYDSSVALAAKAMDTNLVVSSKIRNAFILSTEDSYGAEKEFFRLLTESNSNLKNRLECLNGLALIYENRGENAEALDYYLKALAEADALNDVYFKGILLNNIGLIKLKNEQYDDALLDFEQALVYAENVNEIRLTYNLQNNIGLIFYSQENYAAAAKHYLKTLSHAKKIGFPYAIAIAHLNLSNSYNFIEKYDSALAHADSSIIFMDKALDYSNYSLAQYLKAGAKRKLNRGAEALSAAEKGIEHAFSQNDLEKISQGFEINSTIYEDMGDFKAALNALQEHYIYKDSLDEIGNKARIAELQIAYKSEKRERTARRTRQNKIIRKRKTINRIKNFNNHNCGYCIDYWNHNNSSFEKLKSKKVKPKEIFSRFNRNLRPRTKKNIS